MPRTPVEKPWWQDYAVDYEVTGSRVICEPAPEDTDQDFIVLVDEDSIKHFEKKLEEDGWIDSRTSMKEDLPPGIIRLGWSTSKPELKVFPDIYEDDRQQVFRSWKKEDKNLILTLSPEYFENFMKATRLAWNLNLLDKEDRITLFEAVTYDKWPQDKPQRDEYNRIKIRKRKLRSS